MIHLAEVSPAPNYECSVNHPGHAFLAQVPSPSGQQFREHNYWSRIHTYLYDAYYGICSYCSSWIPRASNPVADNHSTVDHFLPKGQYPQLAYEWTNFRLARKDINENKGADCEIVDPFFIQDAWFELDFDSSRIKASFITYPILKQRIIHTIQVLRLNEPPFIDERVDVIVAYAHGRIEFRDLEQHYPFIAKEILRQKFDSNFKQDIISLYP